MPLNNRNYARRHLHQAEAFREIRLSFNYTRKMQILFPTGGGKTNTQIDTIRYYLHNYCNHKTGVVVVLAPRIQLCIQHMEEHMNNPKYLGFHGRASSNTNNRVKIHPMAVHSGDTEDMAQINNAIRRGLVEEIRGRDGDDSFNSVYSTTNPLDIQIEYDRVSSMKNTHFIIFATYDSASRLAQAGIPIDMIIADEAHNLVQDKNKNLHNILNPDYWLFFTATQKFSTSSFGHGMNNEDLFGPVAYQVHPKTLIDRGILCSPRLHVMSADGIRLDGITISGKGSQNNIDRESNFTAVKEIIKKQTILTGFDPKILVACKDVAEAKHLEESFREDVVFKGWDIFHVSSAYGNLKNGIKFTRNKIMEEINNTEKKTIIFHYDILSEGIDVDGISGVVFLRDMGKTKTIQTIGRALRPKKNERHLPIHQRTKQNAWVSIPTVKMDTLNAEDYESIKLFLMEITYAMIDGGLITPEDISTHSPHGVGEEESCEDPIFFDGGLESAEAFRKMFDLRSVEHFVVQKKKAEADLQRQAFNKFLDSINTEEAFFALFEF